MKKLFPLIYGFVLLTNIISEIFGFAFWAAVTKPMLMPILMIYYLISKSYEKIDYKFLAALLFSLLGDVFLQLKNHDFFIQGLVSFLMAHLFYCILFYKKAHFSWQKTLPILGFSLFYFGYLRGFITPEMQVPVLIYSLVISLMVILAVSRNSSLKNHKIIVYGAILFMLSDSILAYNKFVTPLPLSSLLIMSTYGLAQFLITKGWISEEKN